MNRRVFINLMAGLFVVLLMFALSRAMNYEPDRVPAGGGSREIARESAPAAEPAGEAEEAPVPGSAEHLAAAAALVTRAEVGFRSAENLAEHYAKHGAEFGEVTEQGYLLLAQALRDRPVEGDVLERKRPDGVITRFDRASGAFLAYNADLTIRTFFRPNDGESYFMRQSQRDE